MTHNEMNEIIGTACKTHASFGGQRVTVTGTILDVKEAYGKTRYLVKLDGQAAMGWVQEITMEGNK